MRFYVCSRDRTHASNEDLNQKFNINIDFFTAGALANLVSLRTLNLSHNAIQRTENGTNSLFEDALSLLTLDLSFNWISSIFTKTFPQQVLYKPRSILVKIVQFLGGITIEVSQSMLSDFDQTNIKLAKDTFFQCAVLTEIFVSEKENTRPEVVKFCTYKNIQYCGEMKLNTTHDMCHKTVQSYEMENLHLTKH